MKYILPKDREKQLKDGRSIVRSLRNMEASDIEIKKDLKERGFNQDRVELIFNSLLIEDLKKLTKGKTLPIFRKIRSDLRLTNLFMKDFIDSIRKLKENSK